MIIELIGNEVVFHPNLQPVHGLARYGVIFSFKTKAEAKDAIKLARARQKECSRFLAQRGRSSSSTNIEKSIVRAGVVGDKGYVCISWLQ